MRVTILNEKLMQALNVVGKGVASRPQLPVLTNVLIRTVSGGVEFLSTDLEISFRIKVGAKVMEEGEVAVSGRVLSELVATLPPGPVELVVEKESLLLEADGIRSAISSVSSGEFPEIPSFSGKADVEVGIEELVSQVERVGLASAKDDTRPVLTGILWGAGEGEIKLVATDGYRLSLGELRVKDGKMKERLILPARALLELVRIAGKEEEKVVAVRFETEKQQVVFKLGEVEIVSRLLSGEFPPYEAIIPATHITRVIVGREVVLEAVRRASIFARESANIVKLAVGEGKITVSANGAQTGSSQSELSAEVEGEGLEVAFNSRYLSEYLGVVTSERIVFESEGSLRPGVFKEEGEEWTHIIMPVRVQG